MGDGKPSLMNSESYVISGWPLERHCLVHSRVREITTSKLHHVLCLAPSLPSLENSNFIPPKTVSFENRGQQRGLVRQLVSDFEAERLTQCGKARLVEGLTKRA